MKLKIAVTGALGYSGSYIARELCTRGHEVVALTNSVTRENPLELKIRPLSWNDVESLTDNLCGCDVLVNTYWVRFNHKRFTHAQAVENTKTLFSAARNAGVKRIVHTSITHPDEKSSLSYFRGKAELESFLQNIGIPCSILRPAVLFGETPEESILIGNMAWALRRFPFVGVFGDGKYRVQAIHVRDFAQLAVREVLRTDAESAIVNAVGPETYSFRELWKMLGKAIACERPVLSIPAWLGWAVARLAGIFFGDVMLTRDEVRGLMEDRLAVDGAVSAGQSSLREWCSLNAQKLGEKYASELSRRR